MSDDYNSLLLLEVPVEENLPAHGADRDVHEKQALTAAELKAEGRNVDPNPSEAQKHHGNYKHGHCVFKGIPIAIETAKGQWRRGKDDGNGKPWRTQLHDYYGRIKRVVSNSDGDEVDVFLAGDTDLRSEVVFVINQVNPKTRAWDEHKVVCGVADEEAARALYLRNYQKGWQGLDSIVALTLDQFKWWLDHGDTSKPLEKDYFLPVEARKKAKAATDVLAPLKAEVALEKDLAEKEEAEKKLQEDLAVAVKLANTYHWTGDCQGVHLRATLHKILDAHKAKGMAYNDARTGDVYANIEAPDKDRAQILQELDDYMRQNPKVTGYKQEEVEHPDKLRHVELDDAKLKRMFDRQGFTSYIGWEHDPAAYRRHYVTKRYRLQEDPKTHRMLGDVPLLAYKQLSGLEPMYRTQITHPESFMEQFWAKGQFLPVNTNKMLEAPQPDLLPLTPKLAEDRLTSPKILRFYYKEAADKKKRPFTLGVDLDGTLAKNVEPFDADIIGEPREDAKRWMEAFKDAGAKLIIWTVRGDRGQISDWLKEHDIPFDAINENAEDQPEGSSAKLFCDAFLDDRGVDAADLDAAGAEVLKRIHKYSKKDDKEDTEHGLLIIERTRILLTPEDLLEDILDYAEQP